jgi:tripartite-type tricarboxylate transporter receptor subunit TctC
VTQALQPKVTYDIQRSFAPISELVTIPQLLSVHPSLPINSVKELVAYAKSKPGELTHGNSNGSSAHVAMELLAWNAGIKTLHVPYKGSGPTMVDLMAGQINAGFDVIMTTLPPMKQGKLRTLAVTSPKRSRLLPNIPTVAESGFPGFEASVSFGLFAPAGTPAAVINKISEDTRRILTDPKMREILEAQGFEIVASNPSGLAAKVDSEVKKWRKLTADASIKLE